MGSIYSRFSRESLTVENGDSQVAENGDSQTVGYSNLCASDVEKYFNNMPSIETIEGNGKFIVYCSKHNKYFKTDDGICHDCQITTYTW
jgi:nitrite reductase/ring-hydroxylating ferredoxin subunit